MYSITWMSEIKAILQSLVRLCWTCQPVLLVRKHHVLPTQVHTQTQTHAHNTLHTHLFLYLLRCEMFMLSPKLPSCVPTTPPVLLNTYKTVIIHTHKITCGSYMMKERFLSVDGGNNERMSGYQVN